MTCIALYRYRGSRGLSSAGRLDRYGAVSAHEYVGCGMWGHLFFGKINCMYGSTHQPAISLIYHFAFRRASSLFAIQVSCDFAIPPSCHVTIPPSHHFNCCMIPPFRGFATHHNHSAISAFYYSTTCVNFGIQPFRFSATPPFYQLNISPVLNFAILTPYNPPI